jgi:hypothetical protein
MHWTRIAAVAGLAALVAGAWAPRARATHASACDALPAAGTRLETYGCNPRQNCLNDAGGNQVKRAACNALPTSGSCTRTVNTTPRADCIAALPAPPPLTVSGVAFHGGGTDTYRNANGVLFVRGTNVAAPGVSLTSDGGGYTASISPPRPDLDPSCVGPGCLTVSVHVQGNASLGTRTLTLHSGDGHRTATAQFHVVAEPASTTTAGGGSGGGGTHKPISSSSGGGPGAACAVLAGGASCPAGKTFNAQTCSCQ